MNKKTQRKLRKAQRKKLRQSETVFGPVVGALKLALETLDPYTADSRVAALHRDLQAKLDGWSQHESQLADALVTASKSAAQIAPGDADSRAQVSKAITPAQIEYLRQMSPAAAQAFESSRAA
jgi:hypothetical protein